jgi:hypothetical protein
MGLYFIGRHSVYKNIKRGNARIENWSCINTTLWQRCTLKVYVCRKTISNDGQVKFACRRYREKGTAWRGAMRSRSHPGQVTGAGFGPRRIAVTQRVHGCYCVPTRRGPLWRAEMLRPTKGAERRGQSEDSRREESGRRQTSDENFQNAGDVTNRTAGS